MSELPAPPPDAVELLRAWLAGGELHCALQTDAFEDPAAWGDVLADLARHVAGALAEQEGKDPTEALRAVRAAFEENLAGPAEGPP
jgi:hypothetical protein